MKVCRRDRVGRRVSHQALTRSLLAVPLTVILLALSPHATAQTCDNNCDAGESPDVIVGDLVGVTRWGVVGGVNGITAFSMGTTSCNIGTCWLNWFSSTPNHPVIGQNIFRLKNGRFEQLGQSWLKHGFTALAGNICGGTRCIPPDGTHLGVNCSDPYDANLNGGQTRLGPKFEVNTSTGVYPYPPTNGSQTGDAIFKRLQVHNVDLDPGQNAGATYYGEGQYVTLDDTQAKNHKNNTSYRPLLVSGVGGSGTYTLALTGTTQRQMPAIMAWAAADPGVQLTDFNSDDGRLILGAKVTALGGGQYHYEYALYNMNSNRSAGSFSVPIPFGANITNIGFHDVDYHSGEPFSGTDWTATVGATSLTWATETFAQNANANALRWGTLYNFRFDADVAPSANAVVMGMFRPGTPPAFNVNTLTPSLCNANGRCDQGETCTNCAADCAGQGGGAGCCGNGTCEVGENPCRCTADCGVQRPSEFPCGNGIDDDCDGQTDCADADCCTDLACAGSDPDGDGYAVCDCDNTNGQVWAKPGEALNLMLTHILFVGTNLGWNPPLTPGGTVTMYDTLRSPISSNFVGAASCVGGGSPLLSSTDPTDPSPGQVYSYLVRAKNACPSGEGTLGNASNGTPRAGRSCP